MASEGSTALELTLKCPICGSNLHLIENSTYIILGCPHCKRYTRMTKRYAYKNFIEYDRDKIRLKWAELIKELYIRISAGSYQGSNSP